MKLFLSVLPLQKLKIARYFRISVRPKRPKNSIHSVADKIKTGSKTQNRNPISEKGMRLR